MAGITCHDRVTRSKNLLRLRNCDSIVENAFPCQKDIVWLIPSPTGQRRSSLSSVSLFPFLLSFFFFYLPAKGVKNIARYSLVRHDALLSRCRFLIVSLRDDCCPRGSTPLLPPFGFAVCVRALCEQYNARRRLLPRQFEIRSGVGSFYFPSRKAES